ARSVESRCHVAGALDQHQAHDRLGTGQDLVRLRQIVFVLEAGDVLGHDGRALRWRAADGSGERDALVSAPRAAAPAGADPPWAGRDARDDRTLLLTWAIAGSLAIVPPRARTGDRRGKALGAPREPRGRTAAQRAVWDRCGQCAKTRTRRSASPHL